MLISNPDEILSATGNVSSTPKSIPTGKILTLEKPTTKQVKADKTTFKDFKLNNNAIGLKAVRKQITHVIKR